MHQRAPFQLDAVVDTKAVVDDEGDLIVEGYASDFETDRDGEAFEPGAFEKGLQQYLTTNPQLLYHHDTGKSLGRVETAFIDEKGLFIRARIAKPAPGSWAEDVYVKVKRGFIKAFSVGGFFKRRSTEKGLRIFDVDLAEISVTPVPVNPRTLFAVAGKSFKGFDSQPDFEAVLEKLDEVYQHLSERPVD